MIKASSDTLNIQSEPARTVSKADVLEAAKLLFSKQGYQQTSTRQIAATAGLKSGSIYHHFQTKEDILHAIVKPYVADILPNFDRIATTSPTPREAFRNLLDFSLRVPTQRPHVSNIVLNEWAFFDSEPSFSYVNETWTKAREIWGKILAQGASEGIFRNDLNIRLVVQTITALIASVARDQVRYEWPVDDLIQTQTSILVRGLEPERELPNKR